MEKKDKEAPCFSYCSARIEDSFSQLMLKQWKCRNKQALILIGIDVTSIYKK